MAANVTENYGALRGVSKDELAKSLVEGTPVTVTVGDRKETVEATVFSMECGTNARRFFKVVFEGDFWQGRPRRVTVEKYDTDGGAGGPGVCQYLKREHAY